MSSSPGDFQCEDSSLGDLTVELRLGIASSLHCHISLSMFGMLRNKLWSMACSQSIQPNMCKKQGEKCLATDGSREQHICQTRAASGNMPHTSSTEQALPRTCSNSHARNKTCIDIEATCLAGRIEQGKWHACDLSQHTKAKSQTCTDRRQTPAERLGR